MKKNKIFLILLSLLCLIGFKNVKAESASFYEAETIEGIYMNRYDLNNNWIHFQKARFFRKVGTNEYAYCLEPFRDFYDNEPYESTENPSNLTQDQINMIKKVAYYGYGYKNHTEPKWYAITQYIIWNYADPSGEYYFTNGLNGPRIEPYWDEINEIIQLTTKDSIYPSIQNKNYYIVEGKTLVIEDTNKVLNNYQSNNPNIKIEDNKLIAENLKEGDYTITLEKKDTIYQKPLLFYQSPTSQNVVITGEIEEKEFKIHINVEKTYIEVLKIDKDTKTTTPSGEASFDNTTFKLLDNKQNIIKEFTLKNNQEIIRDLDYGSYYLYEIQAGEGYKMAPSPIKINILREKTKHHIVVENEVIKKKFIIQKYFGEENNLEEEEKVSFIIKNNKEETIDTVTTNEQGIVEFTLPYGTYTLIQQNSKEGYEKLEPITLTVEDEEDEYLELRDLKIPVPDTHKDKASIYLILFLLLWPKF